MSTHPSPHGFTAAPVTRRLFLRGLGVGLALPTFESFGPGRILAEAAASSSPTSGAPTRAAFIFFPNGAIPSTWWPKEGDAPESFEWSPTLQPLEAVRKSVQVLQGLNHRNAEPGPDGAGDHARGNGTFLTGVRLKKSATDLRAGVSIDQVIARAVGGATRFSSLELTCDQSRNSGACDSGYACAYQYNISWSSDATPMAPESNPRMIFERLFGRGERGERAANFRRRQQEQRSLLDFVQEDARGMRRRLGHRDQEKLDQYLTGIRDIEKRIEKAEKFGATPDPDVATPPGIPTERAQYVQLMYDMMLVAFQTDSTRVATLLLAHDGDNRPYPELGVPEGHHDLSHHFNDSAKIQKISLIDRWYVEQFSKFLQKLDTTKESDGRSLLEHSMIVFGSGNADANRHTHSNLPVILAGGGSGGLRGGRYVKCGSKPMSNLFLSMADRMGVRGLDRFGDSDARLQEI